MPGEADHHRRRASGAVPIRASDAERERTMEVLRDASAEGRLTFEELADRIEAAGRAGTRDDLAALTVDLPPTHGRLADVPAGSRDGGRPPVVARDAERRRAVFGDVRQVGPWRVPGASRWSSVFGDVVVDLRDAVVAQARIEIHADSVFGDITLLVPDGVVVDVHSRTTFGTVRQDAGRTGPPDAPVVVLTGGTWFGDVRVPAPARRLRDRLADALRARLGP